jgi:hypothetical protein
MLFPKYVLEDLSVGSGSIIGKSNIEEFLIILVCIKILRKSLWLSLLLVMKLLLNEICPRGNNNIVIIIFLVHDNVYIPC